MKKLISPVIWLMFIQMPGSYKHLNGRPPNITPSQNLFIITLDGFRWQEVFRGADSVLINDDAATADAETTNLLYGGETTADRRKKLLPFLWSVIAAKGQLLGNRDLGNKLNVLNDYALSYPGYNEMLTGYADPQITGNRKINNPNGNVLEYLAGQPGFTNKIVAFTSWDVFPFILNTERSKLPVNSGYTAMENIQAENQTYINAVQKTIVKERPGTRQDMLTFLTAKEYIREQKPRVVFLGLGETDEYAHEDNYTMYLQKASEADRMIGELWQWVQSTPGYRNNTTFIITTDHGRGSKKSRWTSHGQFISGSSQTWAAMLGPGIHPLGEVKDDEQQYTAQFAQTISAIVGEDFTTGKAAPPLSIR
jgi:hypothetical protein